LEKWLFLWYCYFKKMQYDYILDEGMVECGSNPVLSDMSFI